MCWPGDNSARPSVLDTPKPGSEFTMKEALTSLLDIAVNDLIAKGQVPEVPDLVLQIDHTRDPSHGDLATNLAMVLAKKARMAPRDLAAAIIDAPTLFGSIVILLTVSLAANIWLFLS